MDLYQGVTPCPNCQTRLTLSVQVRSGRNAVTRHEVKCPACRSGVAFAIRGVLDPATATLICFERPVRAQTGEAP